MAPSSREPETPNPSAGSRVPEPSPGLAGRVPVGLAAGPDPGPALAAAIGAAGGLGWAAQLKGEIVVVSAAPAGRRRRDGGAALVAEILRRRADAVRIVAPPSPLQAARGWPRPTDQRRVGIDVSGRAEHLDRVSIPRALAEAAALVAVSSVDADGPNRGPLAIGLWTRYARPAQALASRLTGDRLGLAAEIALAFSPRLIILTAELRGQTVAVATPDPIAAELLGLALRRDRLPADADDLSGPWENPLVQRATELGLGITLPSQIDLRPVWTGPAAAAPRLAALADRLRLTLGIPSPNAPA